MLKKSAALNVRQIHVSLYIHRVDVLPPSIFDPSLTSQMYGCFTCQYQNGLLFRYTMTSFGYLFHFSCCCRDK